MCKSSNGGHCLHMAASQKDFTAMGQILTALRDTHGVSNDDIKTWLNWPNGKGLAVRDIAAYNRECHRVVREWGGEFAVERPTAFDQPRVPPDHHWNRQNYRR